MISYDETNAEVISVTESSGGGRMTIIMRTDRNEESEARVLKDTTAIQALCRRPRAPTATKIANLPS